MEPGDRIGGFVLRKRLGEGGMGAVFLAENEHTGVGVAIKILRAEFAAQPAVRARFLQEARAAGHLLHPGVVRIYDCGVTAAQVAYLIMEHLHGDTLRQRLRRAPAGLPTAQVLRLGRQIVTVLTAATAVGVIHRDLKPDNIIVVPDDEVPGGERPKLLDFGIAKLSAELRAGHAMTQTGMIMGTPTYMAPEQATDSSKVDGRADIYALGVMLYELLCGTPPFQGDNPMVLLMEHCRTPVPALRGRAPQVSAEVAACVESMLAKAPSERPTLRGLAETLAALEARLAAPSIDAPAAPRGPSAWRVTLAALLAFALGWWSGHVGWPLRRAPALTSTGQEGADSTARRSAPAATDLRSSTVAAPPEDGAEAQPRDLAAPDQARAPAPRLPSERPPRSAPSAWVVVSEACVSGGSAEQRQRLAPLLRNALGRAVQRGDVISITRLGEGFRVDAAQVVLDRRERRNLEITLTEALRGGMVLPVKIALRCP